MEKYHIVDSSAHSKNGFGPYRKIGIIRRQDGRIPLKIQDSPNQEIITQSGRVFSGQSEDCQYVRAYNRAEQIVLKLNSGQISESEACL